LTIYVEFGGKVTEYDRWKNRRRMAWICMVAAIGFPLLVLFSESRALGEIATPFYMFVSAVVGAYVGFASWEDVKMKQRSYKDWHNDSLIEPEDFGDNRRR
jgi:hypothetical protein